MQGPLEAASHIGDQQVRNRGTIGGTICHADPAGDIPAAVLALEAEFKAKGPSKQRIIKAHDFFLTSSRPVLEGTKSCVEVRVPLLPPKSGGAYLKLERGSGDMATVGVAAVVSLDKAGAFNDARIGLAGVGSTPMRATKAEKVLKGQKPIERVIEEAADIAGDASNHPPTQGEARNTSATWSRST